MNLKNKLKSFFGISSLETLDVGKFNEKARKQWLEKTLKNIPEGNRILDAGAGQQQYKIFCSHLNYVSQDSAEYKPEELKAGLQKVKWDYGVLDIISDIASIPCKEDSFDALMCIEVLEHVINPREAIKEFSRLLKPAGLLILTAPFSSLTHFAPYHFYSGFNRFFYETELAANGFEIIQIETNGNYFDYLAQEVNRLPKISKQYSDVNLNSSQINSINKVKKILKSLSEKDVNSSELLCYGYHVLAKKK